MRLLIDAHALLWWLSDDQFLSEQARNAIQRAEEPLVGAGTITEIAIKQSTGKLPVAAEWPEEAQADGIGLLAITWMHVAHLRDLSYVEVNGRQHRDPFDRLLIAQALTERIPVVTRDPAFAAYGIPVLW
jgi:PIN domain nuclease of toxin-antitoxin system